MDFSLHPATQMAIRSPVKCHTPLSLYRSHHLNFLIVNTRLFASIVP
jgi:hypothetical protein